MSKLLIVTLSMFCAAALAMGPDPGGHTGAGVTPETTKTGRLPAFFRTSRVCSRRTLRVLAAS